MPKTKKRDRLGRSAKDFAEAQRFLRACQGTSGKSYRVFEIVHHFSDGGEETHTSYDTFASAKREMRRIASDLPAYEWVSVEEVIRMTVTARQGALVYDPD